MKDNLIKIDNVLLTIAELIIAFVLLSAKSMTVAEAATEAHQRGPSSDSDVDPQTYASGNTACEMLILAGIAEWDNKTRSRIRITEGGREHKKDISNAYTKWQAKNAGHGIPNREHGRPFHRGYACAIQERCITQHIR